MTIHPVFNLFSVLQKKSLSADNEASGIKKDLPQKMDLHHFYEIAILLENVQILIILIHSGQT